MSRVKLLTTICTLAILSISSVQAAWWSPKGKCRVYQDGNIISKHTTEEVCKSMNGDWINYNRAIH